MEIKGFRKGKAPQSEIQKHLSKPQIYNQAFQALVSAAFDFALEQKSVMEPFTPPSPTPLEVSDQSLVIGYTFELKPEISLGKYTDLKIEGLEKQSLDVTDSEVEDVLKQYQDRFAMENVKPEDAKIEKGDVVTFDFTGYVDSKPFPGGEAKNHKLEIGSGQFIPGFEDSMIGLNRGKHSINVVFPSGYSESLSDKEAEFKLDIHEIAAKELPLIDDELAKDLAIKDVETLEQLKTKIKADLKEQKAHNQKHSYVDRLLLEIIKQSKITLPKTAIDHQLKHLREDFERSVEKEGMTLKEYKKVLGLTDEALDAQLTSDAENELKVYLVSHEIAKLEKLEVSDQEVEAKFQEFSKLYGIDEAQLKSILQVQQVKDEIQNDKLMNFLYENN
jgi:trigger factor